MLKELSNETNETPLNFKNRMITEINTAVSHMFGFVMTIKVAFTKYNLETTDEEDDVAEEKDTGVTLH